MAEPAKNQFPTPTHWRDGTPIRDEYGNAPDHQKLKAARGQGWAKELKPTRDELLTALARMVGSVDAIRWCYESGQEPSGNLRDLLWQEADRARQLYAIDGVKL